jgi:hypothetical protein
MRKQQELMREIELRRKMKATVVPTNDQEVRRMLRQLQEPITQFGEREVRGARGKANRSLHNHWLCLLTRVVPLPICAVPYTPHWHPPALPALLC